MKYCCGRLSVRLTTAASAVQPSLPPLFWIAHPLPRWIPRLAAVARQTHAAAPAAIRALLVLTPLVFGFFASRDSGAPAGAGRLPPLSALAARLTSPCLLALYAGLLVQARRIRSRRIAPSLAASCCTLASPSLPPPPRRQLACSPPEPTAENSNGTGYVVCGPCIHTGKPRLVVPKRVRIVSLTG